MGSFNKMLRLTSSLLFISVSVKSSPVAPQNENSIERNNIIYQDNIEYHIGDSNIVRPNCGPNLALLKVGNWTYVRNSGSRSTKDVWFTYISTPKLNWKSANTACKALGKNFYLASMITKAENKGVAGIHKGNDSHKCWFGG